MIKATQAAHEAVREVLQPGETAIDATCGNGHDALFLAGLVGTSGTVHVFDIQAAALARGQERLAAAALLGGGTATMHWHEIGHQHMLTQLPHLLGKTGAVMFNLGYLPGGDKGIVTRPDTTVAALDASLKLLRPHGILTVVIYTGHPGADAEEAAVLGFVRALPVDRFALRVQEKFPPTAPYLVAVVRLR